MSIPREEAIRAIQTYFDALVAHDVSGVPLAEDVVFKQPNGNIHTGREAVSSFLNNLTWTSVRIEDYVVDGDSAGCLFDYDRAGGSIKGFDYFLFENGSIKEVRPFLNPMRTSS